MKIQTNNNSKSSKKSSFIKPRRKSCIDNYYLQSLSIQTSICITKTQPYQGYFQFCLLNDPILQSVNRKKYWGIQIKKLTGFIYLGISLKEMLKKNGFTDENIDWDELGHGNYLISSNGYCNSHSSQEFNNMCKSFSFHEGDVIEMEYDPITWSLTFKKNKSQQFTMPIIPPPENDEYHPCIQFSHQNDSVKILYQN